MFKRFPIHTFLFAVFPILTLLAHNIREAEIAVTYRSLFVSLGATSIIFVILWLLFRNACKAGLVTSFLLFLFFSYGHVYEFLQAHPIFGFSLGRHRYLAILYVLILVVGIFLLWKKVKDVSLATQLLNLVTVVLLIYPSYQIVSVSLQKSIAENKVEEQSTTTSDFQLDVEGDLPDIYFIILDAYTRADAFERDLGFDNSHFIDELSQMGFHVASCSRSNYNITQFSLTSILNMEYIDTLQEMLSEQGLNNENDVWVLLRQSKVRDMLTSLGYQTVAFESGFTWSTFRDADIYLKPMGKPYQMQMLNLFEYLLVRSTALLIWSDSTYKAMPEHQETPFSGKLFPFEEHINRQFFILDQLPKVASYPGHKFVFAHMVVPHYPFIFEPDGSIVTDPNFYSGERNDAITEEYQTIGYLKNVQFLNNRIPAILEEIIAKSKTPPIIIVQGDHGLRLDNRLQILNAYYLPDGGDTNLYETITPVNSFRMIFDTYFGTDFGFLPDFTYFNGDLYEETAPECILLKR